MVLELSLLVFSANYEYKYVYNKTVFSIFSYEVTF